MSNKAIILAEQINLERLIDDAYVSQETYKSLLKLGNELYANSEAAILKRLNDLNNLLKIGLDEEGQIKIIVDKKFKTAEDAGVKVKKITASLLRLLHNYIHERVGNSYKKDFLIVPMVIRDNIDAAYCIDGNLTKEENKDVLSKVRIAKKKLSVLQNLPDCLFFSEKWSLKLLEELISLPSFQQTNFGYRKPNSQEWLPNSLKEFKEMHSDTSYRWTSLRWYGWNEGKILAKPAIKTSFKYLRKIKPIKENFVINKPKSANLTYIALGNFIDRLNMLLREWPGYFGSNKMSIRLQRPILPVLNKFVLAKVSMGFEDRLNQVENGNKNQKNSAFDMFILLTRNGHLSIWHNEYLILKINDIYNWHEKAKPYSAYLIWKSFLMIALLMHFIDIREKILTRQKLLKNSAVMSTLRQNLIINKHWQDIETEKTSHSIREALVNAVITCFFLELSEKEIDEVLINLADLNIERLFVFHQAMKKLRDEIEGA